MADKTLPFYPGLIDSHCHLDYAPMSDDLPGTLARAAAAGVEQLVHIGCSTESMDRAVALADANQGVYAAVGVHPHDAADWSDSVRDRILAHARNPKVVAIGETGLDYFYDRSPREAQATAFADQLDIARNPAVDKPIVLHVRDAHPEALDIARTRPQRGIVHCFTGGPDEARAWLDLGYHLAFSGIATFPKAAEVMEAAVLCPVDRLLLETDAPYLAPVPVRGRKNEPANVAFTCRAIAAAKGLDPAVLAVQAASNTRALLGLPDTETAKIAHSTSA